MNTSISNHPSAIQWVNQLPSASVLLDKDCTLIDASNSWFQEFGLNRDSTLKKPFLQLFPRLDESWQDSFEYALEGLKDIKMVDKYVDDQQHTKTFLWHINPWMDGYGKAVGIILNVKNLTQDTALELEVKNSPALLTEKWESSFGSWEYNVKDNTVYWSKELKALFGVPKTYEPSLKKSILLFGTNPEGKSLKHYLDAAITTGQPWSVNLPLAEKNRAGDLMHIIGRPKFKNGNCTRIIGTIRKAQKHSPKKPLLSPTTNKPRTDTLVLLEDVPASIGAIALKTGKIIGANHALLDLLGLAKKDVVAKHLEDFLWFTKEERIQWYRSIKTNSSFQGLQKEVFHKQIGQKLIFRFSGKVIGQNLVVSCEDVTSFHLKEAATEAQLALANEELKRITDFTHMASHNLKAHATNFDLLLNFLQNEKSETERANLLKILFQSAENLATSIKGLRELVTIRQQMDSQKKPVDLSDVIYRCLQNNNGLVKTYNAKVHNEVLDGYHIQAIPVYLESIVSNLLVNAIKFKNEQGRPIVFISVEETKTHDVLLIEDNGVGMDLEKQKDKLFALYKTLQNMDNASGASLYLVKYQIELLGGKILVESKIGKGSVFRLFFPKNR